MTLGLIADMVSIVAGAMTILGIGGLVTWSALRRGGRSPFQEAVLGVAATSLKVGFSLIMLAPFAMIWGTAFQLIVIMVAGMLHSYVVDLIRQPWWDPAIPVPYIAAWLVPSLVLLPLYVVTTMCILTWSAEPARGLWRALTGRSRSVRTTV